MKETNSLKTHSLAPVQRQTLEYLRTFISDKGYAPTLKDISNFIGVRSPSTAHFHLSRLEDKGYIRRGEDGAVELLEDEDFKSGNNGGNCAIPLLGLIAAGSPIEVIEDGSVMIDVPPQFIEKKKEIFCLQVTGNSMVDAHIMDGDIIIVAKQETADDGQIVVAVLEDNTATLKTFRRLKGGKVMLIPHNPSMQAITVDKVEIRGRLVGVIRELQ